MKRCLSMVLVLCLTLSLAACGAQDGGTASGSASAPTQSAASSPAAETQSAPAASEDQAGDFSHLERVTHLSRGELIEANEAVYVHYEEAGLNVLTLTEITPEEGEIAFHVAFVDGEADRVISLERQDGQWVVVSEGH